MVSILLFFFFLILTSLTVIGHQVFSEHLTLCLELCAQMLKQIKPYNIIPVHARHDNLTEQTRCTRKEKKKKEAMSGSIIKHYIAGRPYAQ